MRLASMSGQISPISVASKTPADAFVASLRDRSILSKRIVPNHIRRRHRRRLLPWNGSDDVTALLCGASQTHLGTLMPSGAVTSSEPLASLDAEFETWYVYFGRSSIAPELLIRASLIQILSAIRSER